MDIQRIAPFKEKCLIQPIKELYQYCVPKYCLIIGPIQWVKNFSSFFRSNHLLCLFSISIDNIYQNNKSFGWNLSIKRMDVRRFHKSHHGVLEQGFSLGSFNWLRWKPKGQLLSKRNLTRSQTLLVFHHHHHHHVTLSSRIFLTLSCHPSLSSSGLQSYIYF